jgi:hypothetical protein
MHGHAQTKLRKVEAEDGAVKQTSDTFSVLFSRRTLRESWR